MASGRDRTELGLFERIGAALAAPEWAVAAADAPEAAGKAMTDAALLVALSVAALHTRQIVSAVWLLAGGGLGAFGTALIGAVSRAVTVDLSFLFIAGILLTLCAGRRRSTGRDFDLACVAIVPLVAVQGIASLALTVAGVHPSPTAYKVIGAVAYGWAAVVWGIALRHARSRTPAGEDDRDGKRAGDGGARRSLRRLGIATAAIYGAMLALNLAWVARNSRQVKPISKGDLAPGFTLPVVGTDGTIGSSTVSLSSLRGHVVLLDFWATWCSPCRMSMPVVESVYERYRDRGLVVVSINVEGREAAARARRLARSLGVTSTIAEDDGQVADAYKASTIPQMVIIDRRGVVRRVFRGFPGAGRLERELGGTVEQLLAK